jgi:predicted alpha/beta hydrolase
MPAAQDQQAVDALVGLFARSLRPPLFNRPEDYGLEYEDVFFPSLDGTPLEGWFFPADSDRLVICNHFAPGNRSGFPGNIEPWHSISPVEVDFLPEYKALHDAGYNVLTYDLRNHGRSAAGSGGIVANGLLEYRDVIGSLRFAASWAGTREMKVYLRSVCMGANATMVAMAKHPDEFEHVRSMVAPQPISLSMFVERASENIPDGAARIDQALYEQTGFRVAEQSPLEYAHAVRIPTLITQVHDDSSTRPADVEAIYAELGTEDKKLFWIEGTTLRFDGYNYLGRNPAVMLDWFATHA